MRALTGILSSLLLLLPSFSLVAAFDQSRRSINGTGETLPAGEFELGLMETDYGLSDDILLRLPSLMLLQGYARLEARRKFQLDAQNRLSPYIFLGTPSRFGSGMDYGWDFGEDAQHSVTLGARLELQQRAKASSRGPRRRLHALVLPNIEYDEYWAGMLSYVGISDYAPYFGHTWSFTNWQLGLLVSPLSGFIPLPYAYLRF